MALKVKGQGNLSPKYLNNSYSTIGKV